MIVVSARAAALRILAARQSGELPVQTSYSLADYQADAAALARAIMQRRGGVILADDVGLGKTYMAAALIEDELRSGGAPLVVVPAALRATWRQVIRDVLHPGSVRITSHTQLSRGLDSAAASLVVVDEAHAFRNPNTHRYRHLRRSCRSARVLLLTATPINNSLLDLYFLIRLFAADDAFRDVGIGSLKALLHARDVDRGALGRLRREVIIRRTREDLTEKMDWPQNVGVHTVRLPPCPELAAIAQLIDGLTLECYDQEVSRVLVQLGLLKRIQSSHAAGLRSIDRLIALHRDCLAALEQGRLLRPRLRPQCADGQLSMLDVLLPEIPARFRTDRYKMLLDRDFLSLRDARQRLAALLDSKQSALLDLLTARPPPARTIIFTEFRDTAEALWRELRFLPRALITSEITFLGDQPASREEIIQRFAPWANGAPDPRPSEAVYVLVTTDVLAEGLNLQDASAVVSYDLPWNPVRLIQRAGRIDRRGSPHERIDIFNFLPGDELDGFLHIVRRLQSKLFALRSALREQKAVLDPGEGMADKPWEPLSGMLNASYGPKWDVDLDDAGPPGCVGSASPTARRVLLCYSRNRVVRELIFDGGRAWHAHSAIADKMLSAALESQFRGGSSVLAVAVEAGYAFLAAESLAGSAEPAVEALKQAIRQAVARLGLLATPWLVELADKALTLLPGYLGPTAQHVAQLRIGTTASEVAVALERVLAHCSGRPGRCEEAWQLVAAVGAD